MIDFSKLSSVCDSLQNSKPGAVKVKDSKNQGLTVEQLKKVKDAIKKAKAATPTHKASAIKVKDSYKSLVKKIKDELEETETTEQVVETALDNITAETPAEDVLVAVVEALGETIDQLEENQEVPEDEVPEDELEETVDSCTARLTKLKKRLMDARVAKFKVSDGKAVKVTTAADAEKGLWNSGQIDVSEWSDKTYDTPEDWLIYGFDCPDHLKVSQDGAIWTLKPADVD